MGGNFSDSPQIHLILPKVVKFVRLWVSQAQEEPVAPLSQSDIERIRIAFRNIATDGNALKKLYSTYIKDPAFTAAFTDLKGKHIYLQSLFGDLQALVGQGR